jgi:hypothetical protein
VLKGDGSLSVVHSGAKDILRRYRIQLDNGNVLNFAWHRFHFAIINQFEQLVSHLILQQVLLSIDAYSYTSSLFAMLVLCLFDLLPKVIPLLSQFVYLAHKESEYLLEFSPATAMAVKTRQDLFNILVLIANQFHYLQLVVYGRPISNRCGPRVLSELDCLGNSSLLA